jgi:hypothetical protein
LVGSLQRVIELAVQFPGIWHIFSARRSVTYLVGSSLEKRNRGSFKSGSASVSKTWQITKN